MTFPDGGHLRHAPASAGGGRRDAAPALAEADPHLLAGQVGAEVAAALSAAQERVRLLAETGRIGRHSLLALQDEIRQARQVAMLGQQVARLAAGRVRQAPEALELPQLLRDALCQRQTEIAARGLELRQVLQPAPVSADASLLFALLVSLLDWAFEHCRAQGITLSTGQNAWPAHAQLRCDFAWRAPDRLGADADLAFEIERIERGTGGRLLDSVSWRLVEHACAAMGVRLSRQDTAWQVHVQLDFPEAPRRWPRLVDALNAAEAIADDPGAPGRQPLAGCRVLVFAQRPDVRSLVQAAVAPTGLSADLVGSLAELRACGLDASPDAIIVDQRGSEVDRVLADLKAGGSGPALVHVSESFRGLEISSSGRFEILRVGRDTVVRDLPVALGYALSR
jgi:hypothetical protein